MSQAEYHYPWVVKIGGSLLKSDTLRRWLSLFAEQRNQRIIIVPGGSVFADAVREVDANIGLEDTVAHQLAVFAMNQYALVLQSFAPSLPLVETVAEMQQIKVGAAIWLPSTMVLADTSIPQSWDVTSDSLAVWLAKKVNAAQLILIKSVAAKDNVDTLVQEGVVDAAFTQMCQGCTAPTWLLHKAAVMQFTATINQSALAKTAHRIL